MMQLLVIEVLGTVARDFVIAPACEIRSRVAKGATAPGRDVGPVENKCVLNSSVDNLLIASICGR
jgi:hypothetical protein